MTGRPRRGPVIVFGILFWFPLAGVTYQFLHYLIGLRRLGYDPYYVEDSGRWTYDPHAGMPVDDPTRNIAAVAPALEAHGFRDRWAFRARATGRCYGMSERRLMALYGEAIASLNVTGAQEILDEHLTCPRRIYVETDPVACQVRVANGDQDTIEFLDAHHAHFTFGEIIGTPRSRVPVGRFTWLPTRQPVVLDLWNAPPSMSTSAAYTTIATWKNRGHVFLDGEKYPWSKDRQFVNVIDLPRHRPDVPFEIALGAEEEVQRLLRDHGWRVGDAVRVSADLVRYRQFIQASRGEFTVAKEQYVQPRSGWFSDRSACYLAAGRPVITQDTGFGEVLPTGQGLFAFRNMTDILSALDAIERDVPGHQRSAAEIAAEYFDAEKVVGSLMQRAGV